MFSNPKSSKTYNNTINYPNKNVFGTVVFTINITHSTIATDVKVRQSFTA